MANLNTTCPQGKDGKDFKADLFFHHYLITHPQVALSVMFGLNNKAYPLAVKINNSIVKSLGTSNRGVLAKPNLAVLLRNKYARFD